MANMLKSALWYFKEMEYAVIPIRESGEKIKRPYVAWEKYQTEMPELEEIENWWTKWPSANVGIITGKNNNLTVIDIDTDEANEKIEELLPTNIETPMVTTPGGGKHIYFQYEEGIGNKVGIVDGCDVRSEGGYIIAPPSNNGTGIEYKWLDAYRIDKVDIAALPNTLIKTISLYIGSNNRDRLHEAIRATDSYKIQKGYRDDTLFHIGYCLAKGFMPIEEVEQYLLLIGKHCCEPPFDIRDTKIKVDSIAKRISKEDRNISFLVREWALATSGYFSATECHNMLQAATRLEKRAINAELQRLCKEGKIERYGEKKGMYRVVTQITEFEDFKGADDSPLEIRLPFGFEKYVEIYPGDLITFQGVRNVGKTAIALELIRLNMKKHKVFYFSRETQKHVLKRRLRKAEGLSLEDWEFKFLSNIGSYVDILQPDAINIIDYLEATEGEFYKLPSVLADIHQHLKGNAIAIVMLQKRTKLAHAVGGEAVEEKPALVFNVDPNYPNGAILQAKKVKNRKDDDFNVEDYSIRFKLRAGINFIAEGTWEPDYDE